VRATRRLTLVLVLAAGALVAIPVNAGAAPNPGSTMLRPAAETLPMLANSTTQLVQGAHNAAGGCDFTPPDTLRLQPGQQAIELRQIGIDLTNCTSIYETGTPQETSTADADGTTLSAVSDPARATGKAPQSPGVQPLSYSGSGSGYEKAWQTDIINLTVNSVQTNVSWSWNYGCTQSGAGSVNYFWRSGTGWEPPYNNGSWITRTCDYVWVRSNADYKNTGFCWPNTVYSHYRDIAVAGWFDGGFAGSVGTVSHSGNGGCAPLWDHWKLVRVT
jgi:hypothetical protein